MDELLSTIAGHGRCGQQSSAVDGLLTALNFGRPVINEIFL